MSHTDETHPASSSPVHERKRKRESGTERVRKSRKIAIDKSNPKEEIRSEILLLESDILESRKNYNSITTLLDYARSDSITDDRDIRAKVSVYRVFCKLMVLGNLTKIVDGSSDEHTIVQWLKERLKDFERTLLQSLRSKDPAKQVNALMLSMRLVKEKAKHLVHSEDASWRNGLFSDIVQALVDSADSEPILEEFVSEYVEKFVDVRYYAFACLANIELGNSLEIDNVLNMLSSVETTPEQTAEVGDFFLDPPSKKKHALYSSAAHKRQAQAAWTSVLRQELEKTQRKRILDLMSYRIEPWFIKVEMLMDFLTDSFNVGGSTSLMALSGLFYLMREKNLDYPHFYPKLYSMLDANILHSKHRSRFFRLLDNFLASTHLPAALVASFIKRLSRLCLHAPPSGIVVVVPWIYNLLKTHPTCTFMIHRTASLQGRESAERGDPFIMNEPDPMETDAIESSLWEIHTLQSHYHPNVASIAKIISEQFTKQTYHIEDFLDHSYATMLDAELSKDIKKAPEVEYEIPKKIFTKFDAEVGEKDSLLVQLWDFS